MVKKGSGWHGEPRRHAEAVKKGLKTRYSKPKVTKNSKLIQRTINKTQYTGKNPHLKLFYQAGAKWKPTDSLYEWINSLTSIERQAVGIIQTTQHIDDDGFKEWIRPDFQNAMETNALNTLNLMPKTHETTTAKSLIERYRKARVKTHLKEMTPSELQIKVIKWDKEYNTIHNELDSQIEDYFRKKMKKS